MLCCCMVSIDGSIDERKAPLFRRCLIFFWLIIGHCAVYDLIDTAERRSSVSFFDTSIGWGNMPMSVQKEAVKLSMSFVTIKT